jgi:molecular chaperone DnaK
MLLGQFRLEGIPAAPRGMPQIEVAFDIDANGIINVSARDKATGKEQKITITASTNLGKSDVERMVREAEQHAAEDKARRERIELKNNADNMAYQAERTLEDLGEQVSADDKSRVEGLVSALRDAVSRDDEAGMRSGMEQLQQALMQIGQAAYSQNQNGNGQNGAGRDEGVVEGEYTVE